jgi:NAD(P)-dependent dehydrogenase (short-subunit alcohol dehydrogenase family)
MSVDGKSILVTGAARGIGAEAARRLARRGGRLALVGLEPEPLAAVAAECGPEAMWVEADVTDPAAFERAVSAVRERFGGIDVVVANAGIGAGGLVRSVDPAAFERVLEVNLLGTWRTVRACLPSVIERRGYVLVVASMAAVVHAPGMAAYCASKAGAEAFANSLRLEVRHLGVDVGVAYFGFIDTDLVRASDEHPAFGSMRREVGGAMARTYPLSAAGEAIEEGVLGRARKVVVPRYARWGILARGLLPALVDRQAARRVPQMEARAAAAIDELGVERASAPVGPGGAAATAADGRSAGSAAGSAGSAAGSDGSGAGSASSAAESGAPVPR